MNQCLLEREDRDTAVRLASNCYTKLKSCREKLQGCFHDYHKRQFIQMSAVGVSGSVGVARLSTTDESTTEDAEAQE